MYWEHQSNCAIRKGNYKAVKRLDDTEWELYDLSIDRAEQTDISDNYPGLVEELAVRWEQWAKEKYVLPKRMY